MMRHYKLTQDKFWFCIPVKFMEFYKFLKVAASPGANQQC